MKIQAVGNLQGRQISLSNIFASKPETINNKRLYRDTFVRSNEISFGAGLKVPRKMRKMFAVIDETLICPYSGKKMMSSKMFNSIERRKAIFSGKSVAAIGQLRKYEEYFQPTEKKVFDILDDFSQKNPSKTISEILAEVRPIYLQKLKEQELSILYDILEDSNSKLSADISSKVGEKLKSSIESIQKYDNNENIAFLRKPFLAGLAELCGEYPEEEALERIYKKAQKLPTSRESVYAFIVKFSQKNPKTNDYRFRTSADIAMRLLNPSRGTIEHVKPQHWGGKDIISNYLRVSSGANSLRGHIPLDKYVEKNPQIKEYLEEHLKGLLLLQKEGRLNDYRSYPQEIIQTLYEQSKGRLDFRGMKLVD